MHHVFCTNKERTCHHRNQENRALKEVVATVVFEPKSILFLFSSLTVSWQIRGCNHFNWHCRKMGFILL